MNTANACNNKHTKHTHDRWMTKPGLMNNNKISSSFGSVYFLRAHKIWNCMRSPVIERTIINIRHTHSSLCFNLITEFELAHARWHTRTRIGDIEICDSCLWRMHPPSYSSGTILSWVIHFITEFIFKIKMIHEKWNDWNYVSLLVTHSRLRTEAMNVSVMAMQENPHI